MPANTEIHSVMAGEVISSELHPSYGNTVVVQSGSKQVRYAHMNSAEVSTGDVVKKGDIIGYVGSTGTSTGNHLHLEYKIDGVLTNPSFYLEGVNINLEN